jgi:hypothetical protein
VSFRFLLLCAVLTTAAMRSQAAQLKPESVNAWEQFVKAKEMELSCEPLVSLSSSPLLSNDSRDRLKRGEILIRPAGRKGSKQVSSALIHDWIGFIFIPNISLEQVLARTRSYDQYPAIYQPSVVTGKLISRDDNVDRYALTMHQDVFTIKAGLQGEYQTEYHQAGPVTWYSVTRSTRLQEITGFGHADEELLPPDKGNGFVWRIYSSAKYEEADGGVYIQFEAAALSRTVPYSLGWLVNPLVERLSRSALATSLRKTRDGVEGGADLQSAKAGPAPTRAQANK